MKDLTPITPGFYADPSGHIYVNMKEFLAAYALPDNPVARAVIWSEIVDIFGDVEVFEIPPDLPPH